MRSAILVVILGFLWTPWACAPAVVAEGAIVEGDAELLELIRTALITSEAQFERGRLVAEIHDESITGLNSHSIVTVVWEGENTFLDADYHMELAKDAAAINFFDPDERIADSEKEIQDGRLIQIGTPHMVCRYRPGT